jgi:selenide,water dikinase
LKQIILAGAGHANIVALRRLARVRPAAEVLLVNDGRFAWYSGALPALLRGEVTAEAARIDLVALAAACGARFMNARVAGYADGFLALEGVEPVPFDVLAISTGGVKLEDGVKPIPGFLARVGLWEAQAGMRIGVLGAGAAGVELALALRARLGAGATIFVAGREVLPGVPAGAQAVVLRALAAANIVVVAALPEGVDVLRAYTQMPALRVGDDLRVVGEDGVFAAGDCARMAAPLPRSGAIAVRQGRVLATNILRLLRGEALQIFKAPQRILAIVGLGGGCAVGWYGGFWWQSRGVMRVKTWLDERWVR